MAAIQIKKKNPERAGELKKGLFQFTFLPKKEIQCFNKDSIKESLLKWGMKGNLKVKYYNFNKKFLACHKQEFVESFLSDPVVCSTLEIMSSNIWCTLKEVSLHKVTVEQIPCTVTSMTFFDKILSNENLIVRKDTIVERAEELIDGFYVNNNFRGLFLDPNCEQFDIFDTNEKKEFIFQLLMHFCLGGLVCQEDYRIEPYLNTLKNIYKELISVQRGGKDQTEIEIRSIILKVIGFNENNEPVCPDDAYNRQNFLYLIVDPFTRQVITLLHQFSVASYN